MPRSERFKLWVFWGGALLMLLGSVILLLVLLTGVEAFVLLAGLALLFSGAAGWLAVQMRIVPRGKPPRARTGGG